MNGLLAIPTRDALVSTPKPAPCAPSGMTLAAALYAAVIAAPTPIPSSTDATLITQTLADAANRSDPAAADAALPAITVRARKRCSSRPQR